MQGKLIFFQFHQPQLVKKELYRGPVTVTIDKQNFGTGLERQVLQVQGLVYWSTGCNLRNFPSPEGREPIYMTSQVGRKLSKMSQSTADKKLLIA